MNIGSLMSLINCNKCGYPIEIFPSQKEVKCKCCGKINNLEDSISKLLNYLKIEYE